MKAVIFGGSSSSIFMYTSYPDYDVGTADVRAVVQLSSDIELTGSSSSSWSIV